MIDRSMLVDELKLILNTQLEKGNTKLTSAIIEKILEVFERQRPFASGESIIDLIGNCSLIPTEKRAPKQSISFGVFRALQDIKNT